MNMKDSKGKKIDNNENQSSSTFFGGHLVIDICGYIILLCVGIYVVMSNILK